MIERTLPVLLACVALASAAPLQGRQDSGPTVRVANGTIVGKTDNGVDSFLGIPFAQPPVGELRLKPPVSYNQQYPGGTFQATETGAPCPQFAFKIEDFPVDLPDVLLGSPLYGRSRRHTEDCLTINVQRPAGISANATLPVVFWIFGGGFEFGSTGPYDGTSFLQEGIEGKAKGHPVIFVAVNYRVNGFGFLAGKELQAEGSTNIGLRDQRLGLQWVAENIAAFGGDPSKVTLWGESAGSISAFDHTIINGGDNTYRGKPLFRGAILNSGSIVPADPVDTGKAQKTFDDVVSAGGCSSAADKLACLRALDFQEFLGAATSVPGMYSYNSLDLSYLPRPDPNDGFFSISPDEAVMYGRYAKVPIIIGDQEDEGTLFSLFTNNISTNAQLTSYFQNYFPNHGAKLIPGLVATYPDSTGPTRTSIFHRNRTAPQDSNNFYPQFQRMAAILGDLTFTLTRRVYISNISDRVPVWSYMDSHLRGLPIFGTFHVSDLLETFFALPDSGPAITYRTYYTSFIHFLDPNRITTADPLLRWPRWTNDNPLLLSIQSKANGIIRDDFRWLSYQYLKKNLNKIRI